ncbi:MAG: cell division protein SepF [Acutalibacteraceae bacterium]|jgi:cell division inhibitor SepF
MGLLDRFKDYFNAFEDEELEDEFLETANEKEEPKKPAYQEEPVRRQEPSPRLVGKSKTVSFTPAQMQVVLVKPDRYEDVTAIADHLNDRKTVVLNLENADRDVSRRIVDFLSGATYANHGNIRKVSRATFLIVPNGVDMMGDLMLDELEEGKIYF